MSEDDLWRWMSALAEASTPRDVAFAVAEVGSDAADAAFSNLALLDADNDWVRVVHGSSLDPDIADRWDEFPLSAQTPLCEAMLTGRSVLLGTPEAIGEHYPDLLADTLAASLVATASLPLRATNGDCLGAAGFAWDTPQSFPVDQLSRLDLIARLASQALERAQLLERPGQQESTSSPTAPARLRTEDPGLTRREIEVLRLLAIGYRNTEVADLLGVSLRTVESERSQLRRRLNLRTRAELVQFAIDEGLAPISRAD